MRIVKSLTAIGVLVLLALLAGCSLSTNEAEVTVVNDIGIDVYVTVDGEEKFIADDKSGKWTIEWDGTSDYDIKIQVCESNRTNCQIVGERTLSNGDTITYTITPL